MNARSTRRLGVVAVIGVAVTAGGYAFDAGANGGNADAALGPGEATVMLEIDDSRFSTDRVVVRPHTEVRFVVVNNDPINHELIVGGPDVHDRHRDGKEQEHPPVPGEVSVGPDEVASTTYHVGESGTVEFACHLPGHLAYGMVGEVVVEGG